MQRQNHCSSPKSSPSSLTALPQPFQPSPPGTLEPRGPRQPSPQAAAVTAATAARRHRTPRRPLHRRRWHDMCERSASLANPRRFIFLPPAAAAMSSTAAANRCARGHRLSSASGSSPPRGALLYASWCVDGRGHPPVRRQVGPHRRARRHVTICPGAHRLPASRRLNPSLPVHQIGQWPAAHACRYPVDPLPPPTH